MLGIEKSKKKYILFKLITSKIILRPSLNIFKNQAATCYYQSNHSKVEAIPLCALPKDTTSKLAGLSPH